jgi:glycosyltransferase involved in cell wall biosynthesis
MRVEYPFLFNFAASYSQGGYKRLHEYARWFDRNGGAWFAIHPRCEQLRAEFPTNRFFIVSQSHFKRLYDDSGYLDDIGQAIGQPELYYAYGIPLYRRFGRINWFHLQNVLTVGSHAAPLSAFHRLKFRFLGNRFRRGFALADVISAESRYSLDLLAPGLTGPEGARKLFLAVNGSDDELEALRGGLAGSRDNVATAVGTLSYKALGESFRIFQTLQARHPELKLVIIGDAQAVPGWLRRHPDVSCLGTLGRAAVIDWLRRSRFYISSTYVENSYNGAAEGAFLAAESLLSDIPPHRELLAGESCERIRIPGLDRPVLHLHRNRLVGVNLKSWHSLITDLIARVEHEQRGPGQVVEIRPTTAAAPALDDRHRRRSPG